MCSYRQDLDVLPHGIDDVRACGCVDAQKSGQFAGQLVLHWLRERVGSGVWSGRGTHTYLMVEQEEYGALHCLLSRSGDLWGGGEGEYGGARWTWWGHRTVNPSVSSGLVSLCHSAMWLSGPYTSLSSSITTFLKKAVNLSFVSESVFTPIWDSEEDQQVRGTGHDGPPGPGAVPPL